MKAPDEATVVGAIRRLADDGYAPVYDVLLELRGDRRSAQRGLRRAINRGYVLERRGPDGRMNVAVASDGWQLVEPRSAA